MLKIVPKRIFLVFAASILLTNALTTCNIDHKHKKHLAIGAYSILGLYSAKNAWQTLQPVLVGQIFTKDFQILFPAISAYKDPLSRKMAFYATYIFSLAKISLFTYLTYFSAKNILQELEELEKKEACEKASK